MTRRTSTTSRPAIPRAAWEEIRFQFLHKIAALVKEHNVPDVLILNADQTPSKYAPTRNITMELNDFNHAAIAGNDDKRQITLTLVESQSGILYNHIMKPTGVMRQKCYDCLMMLLSLM